MTTDKPEESLRPQKPPHPYYPGLDIVRFVAACLVMAVHYVPRYAWFGWAGVEIFFVISGLVIANSASAETATLFLARRILRLYPAVWICAPISFLALLLLGADPHIRVLLPQYLFSLVLLPKVALIDSVYWTLPIEIAFYGVIFLMLLGRQISRLPTLACFLTFYSGGYVTLMLLPHFYSHFLNLLPDFLVTHRVMAQMFLLQHGCVFAVGMWLYLLSMRFSFLRALGLAFTILFTVEEILLQASIYKAQGMFFMTGPWAQCAAWAVALALIVFSLCVRTAQQQKNNWTRRLGLMTYPLYLIHNAAGVTLIYFLIARGVRISIATALAAFLSLSLAYLVSRFGEPALRGRLRPLLWKERMKTAAA